MKDNGGTIKVWIGKVVEVSGSEYQGEEGTGGSSEKLDDPDEVKD